MSRPIIGIDTASRRLAVCEFEYDRVWHYEAPKSDPETEIGSLIWWLTEEVQINTDHDVWLETNMVGSAQSVQTALRHAMTIGAVLATVGGTLISPTTWKASVLGHGSADADAYTAWVEASSPTLAAAVRGSTTRKQQRYDCYAAFCIAQHGYLSRRRADGMGL